MQDTLQADKILAELNSSGTIEWIEPDYMLELFEVPNDQFFRQQWYAHNFGQEYYGVDRYDGFYNDTLRLKSGNPGYVQQIH